MPRLSLPSLLALLTVLVLIPACGGGAGGVAAAGAPGGVPGSSFVGSYDFHFFAAGASHTTCWGTLDADGTGTVSGGSLTHNNSTTGLSGPSAVAPFPYSISAGNRISLNPIAALEGGLTTDGSVAILASSGNGDSPSIAILGRRQGVHDSSSLAGAYHLCALFHAGADDITWWGGTATFDGVGAAVISTNVNSAGTITPAGSGTTSAYAVTVDGRVTWTGGAFELTGGIYLEGDLVVFSGAMSAGLNALVLMLPVGIGLGGARISGEYNFVHLARFGSPGNYVSATGSLTSDGVSVLRLGRRTTNAWGTVATVDPLPGDTPEPYGIGIDGAMGSGFGTYVGGASADGRVAFLAGGAAPGSQAVLRILLR